MLRCKLWMWCICLGLVCFMGLPKAYALPNHNHTNTVKNKTGQVANDLHLDLVHNATGGKPTAPPFPPGTKTAFKLNFSGANVANGASVNVSWQSKFKSDKLIGGNWTKDNVNIGAFGLKDIKVVLLDIGGGVTRASLQNDTGQPAPYADLAIYTGADNQYFSPAQYLDYMNTGAPVSLMVSDSGTFSTGLTTIAEFAPSSTGYTAGSALIDAWSTSGWDNVVLGEGASQVPEPGMMVLLLAGLPMLRRRRGRLAH